MTTIELAFKPGVTTQVAVDDRNLLFTATQRRGTRVPDQAQVIVDAHLMLPGTFRGSRVEFLANFRPSR